MNRLDLPINDSQLINLIVNYPTLLTSDQKYELYNKMGPKGKYIATALWTGKGSLGAMATAEAYVTAKLSHQAYGAWKKKLIKDNRDDYELGRFPKYYPPPEYWVKDYIKKNLKKAWAELKFK